MSGESLRLVAEAAARLILQTCAPELCVPACADMLRLAMAVPEMSNPAEVGELMTRLTMLRRALTRGGRIPRPAEIDPALVKGLGGTREALTQLLTTCAMLTLTLSLTATSR